MGKKTLLSTILLGGAAAYTAYKNLSEEKRQQLIEQAKKVSNELKDLGTISADSANEIKENVSAKSKAKYEEIDGKLSNSKYANQYNDLKDRADDLVGQTSDKINDLKENVSPTIEKVKETSGKIVEQAKTSIDNLRDSFQEEDIQLVEDDSLIEGLKELDDEESKELQKPSEKKKSSSKKTEK